jgi:hypothetical protein
MDVSFNFQDSNFLNWAKTNFEMMMIVVAILVNFGNHFMGVELNFRMNSEWSFYECLMKILNISIFNAEKNQIQLAKKYYKSPSTREWAQKRSINLFFILILSHRQLLSSLCIAFYALRALLWRMRFHLMTAERHFPSIRSRRNLSKQSESNGKTWLPRNRMTIAIWKAKVRDLDLIFPRRTHDLP